MFSDHIGIIQENNRKTRQSFKHLEMKQHMSKESRVRGSKEVTQKSMKMKTEYIKTCGKQGRRKIYDIKCPE